MRDFLDVGPEELGKLQKEDACLAKIREYLASTSSSTNYNRKRNLIFRRYVCSSSLGGKDVHQLVVPTKLRNCVLKLAHKNIMSGHPGVKRTTCKVWAEFCWSGVQSDVKRFCQSCDICQRTTPNRRAVRAPLGQMPFIDVPFKRVAVDLMGPVKIRLIKGNRYILALIDYATRYPEAIALPSIDTETVAKALLDIFRRVGVLDEILTDTGSQFTSDLMKEVSRQADDYTI